MAMGISQNRETDCLPQPALHILVCLTCPTSFKVLHRRVVPRETSMREMVAFIAALSGRILYVEPTKCSTWLKDSSTVSYLTCAARACLAVAVIKACREVSMINLCLVVDYNWDAHLDSTVAMDPRGCWVNCGDQYSSIKYLQNMKTTRGCR